MPTVTLDETRKEWSRNLKRIMDTARIDEIHVLADPTGFGKTKQFSDMVHNDLAIKGNKILTLVPTHPLANETEEKYDIHLWGKNHFDDCPKKEEFEACKGKTVNTNQILCTGCTEECAYNKQMEDALKSRSVISVHAYLNTTIPTKFFKESTNSLFFIDESPIKSIITTNTIELLDLPTMLAFIEGIGTSVSKELEMLCVILTSMIDDEEEYYNKNFIDKITNIKHDFTGIDWDLYNNSIDKANALSPDVKYLTNNFIPQLRYVVETCYKFKGQDVALPFAKPLRYSKQGHKTIPEKQIDIITPIKSLPDVKTLLFDATANPKLLEIVFPNRKIIEHEATIRNEYKPYQTTNAVYSRKSISDKRVRERIAKAIVEDLSYTMRTNKIGIITHKDYEKWFVRYLQDNGVTAEIIHEHYWNLTGKNDFNECTKLYIIGSPEPDPNDARLQCASLHVGEEPISTERNKDGMYTDPRLQQYVEHIREAELVQAYGRGRTLTNNKIGVYIICSLEIPMETRKRTLKELLGQPTTRNEVALALLLQMGGDWREIPFSN